MKIPDLIKKGYRVALNEDKPPMQLSNEAVVIMQEQEKTIENLLGKVKALSIRINCMEAEKLKRS